MAGLPTPRAAADFAEGDGHAVLALQGRIVDRQGRDLSEAFRLGARQALAIAGLCNCREAILKERSPSCGVHRIYHDATLSDGQGVTAALLARHGIVLYSEEDLPVPNIPPRPNDLIRHD